MRACVFGGKRKRKGREKVFDTKSRDERQTEVAEGPPTVWCEGEERRYSYLSYEM